MRTLGRLSTLGALVALSCAGTTRLEPSTHAETVQGRPGAARASVAGIELVAEAGAWNGDAALLGDVTVLKVSVDNRSAEPVLIAYERFSLVSDDGRAFQALDPSSLSRESRGQVSRTRSIGLPPDAHACNHHGAVARPRAPDASTDIENSSLQTTVLGPGERTSGFIFFERVTPDKAIIRLKSVLQSPIGEPIAETSIPFYVKS